MLTDVFYYGKKPNVHPREKFATSLEDARGQSTTDHFWIINEFCDYRNFDWDFDFEFLPDEDVWAQDHNNVWPSQHQKDSGTWLCPKEKSDLIIYRADVTPICRKNEVTDNWCVLENIDKTKFDFSWHPDPTDPLYIYIWGNKWIPGELESTIEYRVSGATERKYMPELIPLLVDHDKLKILDQIDEDNIDLTWRPDPREPPYIYIWGNKWISGEVESTLEYHVPGATERKYMPELIPLLPKKDNWCNLKLKDEDIFDLSWRPNPQEPARIYQFSSDQVQSDGPRYECDNNNGVVRMMSLSILINNEMEDPSNSDIPLYYITTTLDDLIREHLTEVFWALNRDIDYSRFDFSWRPEQSQQKYIHSFGTSENLDTQTYFVNGILWSKGHRSINYVQANTGHLVAKLDIFYVDKGNQKSSMRFLALQHRFPNIQKTRFVNSWVETIIRCANKSSSKLFWVLNSELEYSEFDFIYYPNVWQQKMLHIFGTQWSHWGTTFMVNKEAFINDTMHVKIIENLPNINFVKNKKVKTVDAIHETVHINHGNADVDHIKQTGALVVDYRTSYIDTFKEILKVLPIKKDHYIWVTSTVCDYSEFDFSYICDPFTKEQLHVFPSDKQKFGDTFLLNVNALRERIDNMNELEDYNKINYNQHQRVKRLVAPKFTSYSDTHVGSLHSRFNFPYAIFTTEDNENLNVVDAEPISLWSEKSKNLLITSTGGTRIIVPKEATHCVKSELYDYPYIKKATALAKSTPMDIVFLSNGELGADENYEHLLNVTKGLENRVVRVDGVNGRVAAYHAAAEASGTPWLFTVFAKLKVNEEFDWGWQPDRLQVPKHYIFHATNPVNGLTYGHMAAIAYNKRLVLANSGSGLDFTLDDEHEVVEMNSGVAVFNTDEWSTWRAAFREVVKLCGDNTEIGKERLNIWLTVATGNFAEYSLRGASDAVSYYNEVAGDLNKLKLSYEWKWLRTYFDTTHKYYNGS